MGKVTLLCVFLVLALLLEDGSSVRKKTEKEEEEDKKIAEAVNRTLVEEEKKRKEDEDEAQQKREEDERKKEKQDQLRKEKSRDEAGACPEADPCPEVGECPPCEPCPGVRPCLPCKRCEDCPLLKECGPCPEENPCPEVKDCLPCRPCGPCPPCPVANSTRGGRDLPPPVVCPEAGVASLSVPAALLVGASVGALVTGVATAIGLLLRYSSPVFSGLLFVIIVVLTWYMSSHYPETARELGGRVVTTLREATIALGNRVLEAIQRHQEQVGFPNNPFLPKIKFQFFI
jgi:hypothetical protein